MPEYRAPHSTPNSATRYEFLDLLRGIAVLLMIEGHSMRALLHWNLRANFGYDIHELIHGLPAPIFIFAAGAALALTRQATPTTATGQPKWHWRRELRLLNVLIIAYALQLSDFSFMKTFFSSTPEKLRILLNFNVLQCIVAGVLLVRALSNTRWSDARLMRVMVSGTVVVGVLTPLIWSSTPQLPMWLGTMLSREHASYFPLFPYIGFALGGAAWGLGFEKARQNGSEGSFLHRTIMASGIIFVLCVALAAIPWPAMYADFWWSSPWYLWLRIAVLTLLCAYLRRWESASHERPGRLHIFLALLGRRSFFVYVGHLIVLYGSSYNYNWNMLRKLGNEMTFMPAAAATAGLAAAMISATIAWDWIKREQPAWAHRVKWGLAAYLTVVFVTSF